MSLFARVPPARPRVHTVLVALAGNPNCGKTTLFNALTGLRHKVGNYPGVTVEKREAHLQDREDIVILDLPGIYSLTARSPDEAITRDILLGRQAGTPRPDVLVIVADATALERHLFLATQLLEMGIPAVLACNMMDQLREAGHELDLGRLSQRLGVPVVGTVGPRREGLNALRQTIERLAEQARSQSGGQAVGGVAHEQNSLRGTNPTGRRWPLDPDLEIHVRTVTEAVRESGYAPPAAAEATALLLLSESRETLNHLPPPVATALAAVHGSLSDREGRDMAFHLIANRYAWLREVVDDCLQRAAQPKMSATDRLDHIFTHPVWGKICFGLVMLALFYSIFTAAEPLMGLIEAAVGRAQDTVSAWLAPGLLHDLLRNGVLAGVGGVLSFYPQIVFLFLFLAILEDSGYMARAAMLMNRLMSRVGLHGKSFIPLLSSHACAIPGILATRTIENPRDRLATILVAPLMSCSARLPVYSLIIAACLPMPAWMKALTLLGLYAFGIMAAMAVARLLKGTLLRGSAPGFIIELPPYRVPRPGSVLRVIWDRSKVFLTKAGTVILALTIVLWALTSFPADRSLTEKYDALRADAVEAARTGRLSEAELAEQLDALGNEESSTQLRQSYAGRLGRMLEPAIRPLGFNWEIGIGLIASFAARELFVGTMGIVYSVGEVEESSLSLQERLRMATWPDGRPLFTPLVAVGLLVFYALACQCLSTVAIVKQETNSWRWPIFMVAYMTLLAYLAALLVHQIGRLAGWT